MFQTFIEVALYSQQILQFVVHFFTAIKGNFKN